MEGVGALYNFEQNCRMFYLVFKKIILADRGVLNVEAGRQVR